MRSLTSKNAIVTKFSRPISFIMTLIPYLVGIYNTGRYAIRLDEGLILALFTAIG